MKKSDKVQIVLGTLQRLYPDPSIPLDSRNPYTHLIAVLLSAQCTDARVNTVTPALFKRADRPQKMVALEVGAIEQIIRPCGLAPRKSQAIWDLSQILLDQHGGEVPADLDALEQLPGVGHKTAQVVMAQNFGVPTFPVAPHIHRLSTGTTCTCRSYTSAASTARPAATIPPSVRCAAASAAKACLSNLAWRSVALRQSRPAESYRSG